MVRDRSQAAWLGPFALAALFAVVAVLLLGVVRSERVARQRESVAADQRAITRLLEMDLDSDREYLLLLAGEFGRSAVPRDVFEARVTQYAATHAGLANVTYADSDFVIRWTAPYEPNKAVIGLKLDLPEPRRASRAAQVTHAPAYTRAFKAVQGFSVIEVYVPIYDQERFLGTLGGVYRLEDLLRRSIPSEILATERIELIGTSGVVAAGVGLRATIDDGVSTESTFSAAVSDLVVRVTRPAEPVGIWWVEVLSAFCVALAVGIAWGMWRLRREAGRRSRADSELRENQALLAAVVGGTTDAIYVKDLEGKYLLINTSAAAFVDRPAEEVIGLDDTALFPAESARMVMEGDRQVMMADGPVTYEEHVVLPSGDERFFRSTKGQLRGAAGEVRGIWGIARDVTDIRRAEAVHREQGERLRLALDLSGQDVWDFDVTSGEIATTPMYAAMIGARPEDVHETVETWGERLHPDDRDRVTRTLQECLTGARDGYRAEFRLRRDDGTYFWLSSAGAISERDPEGRPLRLIGTHFDVTERKTAEEDLRRSERALAELNRELEDRVKSRTQELAAANQELEAFAYSVSHDLRAPLRHVTGFAELLRSHAADRLDETGLHYVDAMSDAARRMGTLIDDLLRFSRYGRVALNIGPVDMQAGAEAAIGALAVDTGERAIEWSVAPLASAMGDPALIQQVWANLLGNAVKYSSGREIARIEVASRTEGGEVVYSVKDNGVGFDPAHAGNLFRVFQRLHSAEEFEGTGIGLANVHRIITRLGGRVWAEAKLSEGATFYFSLPATKEDV